MKLRLINCDFINASSFVNLSNKAKLLYIFMFASADDIGFVDNANNIIDLLTKNDTNQSLELLNNDYNSALEELGQIGLLYRFTNRHGHSVYLIRHWFMHNRWKKGLLSNYGKYRGLVELKDYEYVLKESSKEKVIIKDIKRYDTNTLQDNTLDSEWDMLVNDIERTHEKNDNGQIQDISESIEQN